MPRIVRSVIVNNELGLHTRPATAIVQLLEKVGSTVFFTLESETVNAKSIMGILMLAAEKNAKITITVDGEDAEVVMAKLMKAFRTKFGEKKD